ncbi:class A sortase [Lactococcus taiwanensis]|uniref:class A sortase n=1 Tax=Lactococcus taiwanensis TaxID=1151742 RepID=UPI0035195C7F
MKKSNRSSRLVNGLIALLFIIGVVLIFNKSIQNMLIIAKSNHYQLEHVFQKTIEQNKQKKPNFDFSTVKSVDFQTVLSSQLNSQNLPVIGEIVIPDLKLKLPIFKGVGNSSLLYGAGTMKEEVMGQGNYCLAGHNMTGFASNCELLFSPLEKAKKGMMVYVTDGKNVYAYKIDKINVVTPEHVEVLDDTPNQKEITLVTCADVKATHRIIVHGNDVAKSPFNQASSEIKHAFK